MAAAVAQIGIVLAEHFPRAADDVNELPDRLIEL
jgi:putative membrane protein